MRKNILTNRWEYETITENEYQKSLGNFQGNFYGYRLRIYKNNSLQYSRGGFGSVGTAEAFGRDYMLADEFEIERSED